MITQVEIPPNKRAVCCVVVMIEGPEDTMYEGGLFPATLSFPPGQDGYPNKPPEMRFTTPEFWHPNGAFCVT